MLNSDERTVLAQSAAKRNAGAEIAQAQ